MALALAWGDALVGLSDLMNINEHGGYGIIPYPPIP